MAKQITTEVLEFGTEYPIDDIDFFKVEKRYFPDGTVDDLMVRYIEYKQFNGKRMVADVETLEVDKMKKFIKKRTKKNVEFNF